MVSSGEGRSGRVNVEEIFILRVRNEEKKKSGHSLKSEMRARI